MKYTPRPLHTLCITDLLDIFKMNEEDFLRAIDTDPLLKKRENAAGLVIANATPRLGTPAMEHQLLAKGIVYTRNPYKLASLPLIKVYNHTETLLADDLTTRLSQKEGMHLILLDKADGFMVQCFEHQGQVYFTTRSVIEGSMRAEDDFFDYVAEARSIAGEKYSALLDPTFYKGRTLIFEAITPNEPTGITEYGEERDIRLIAVFDNEALQYMPYHDLLSFAATHNFFCTPEIVSETRDLESMLDEIKKLEDSAHLPEGGVLCFENEHGVVHRVKIKTNAWASEFRLQNNCTTGRVAEWCLNDTALNDTKVFEGLLRTLNIVHPITHALYMDAHAEYLKWVQECEMRVEILEDAYLDADTQWDGQDRSEFVKVCRQFYPDMFHLLMAKLGGKDILHQVMWGSDFPPYKGIFTRLVESKKAKITYRVEPDSTQVDILNLIRNIPMDNEI